MIYLMIITLAVLALTTLVLIQNPKGTSQLVTEKIGVKNHLSKATWIAGALVMLIALMG